MSTGDNIDTVSILLVLQDAGVVFGSQNEQKIFTLALQINNRMTALERRPVLCIRSLMEPTGADWGESCNILWNGIIVA